MTALPYRAFPVILAAPSGTGKTTIAHRLVEESQRFVFSVSATTRPPREGERNGMDYDFVSEEAFERMRAEGELVEWARVHGHQYGTPQRNLEEATRRGEHVVLDIDVQGAGQIREAVADALLIFVFPPSAEALRSRLEGRGTEGPKDLRRRLLAAADELERATAFDYVVVNRELDEAVREVKEIVRAEARRPRRARDLGAEVRRLRDEIEEVLGTAFTDVPG